MKLGAVLAIISLVAAVFRDEAGYVDWRFTHVGRPLHVSEYDGHIAIISDTNTLFLLDKNGNALWRQIISETQVRGGVAVNNGVVVVGGDYLSGYDAHNGSLIWTKDSAANSVFASGDKIIIDSKFEVDRNGTITEVSSTPTPGVRVENNQVELNSGVLSWHSNGVIKLEKDGETIYTRDDGLAHVRDAIFLQIDSEEATTSVENSATSAGASPLKSVFDRVIRHLGEFWSLGWFLVKNGPLLLVLPERIKPQFGFNQVLVALTEEGSVYGLDVTSFGNTTWVYHDLSATRLQLDPNEKSQVLVYSDDGNIYTLTSEGDIVGLSDAPKPRPAEAVEIDGVQIHSSLFGWTIDLPGDAIVGHASKDHHETSGSIVVPTESGDVYYKYLQPYQAVYASYKVSEQFLTLTLVDTVTGRILGTHAHPDPVVINDEWPLQIAFGEYWFAYTYLSLDSTKSYKITMAELFESAEVNKRVSEDSVDVWQDDSVPHISLHSWILPSKGQPAYDLAVSQSPHGAAARELIFAFEHQIVGLPKSWLSTLNPVAELSVPETGHLSHIYGVSKSTKVVVGRTNSEFTYLLAAYGGADFFFTKVAPAGEIDRLNESFPKIKLITLLGSMAFLIFTLSPLARAKELAQQWR